MNIHTCELLEMLPFYLDYAVLEINYCESSHMICRRNKPPSVSASNAAVVDVTMPKRPKGRRLLVELVCAIVKASNAGKLQHCRVGLPERLEHGPGTSTGAKTFVPCSPPQYRYPQLYTAQQQSSVRNMR